MSIEPIDATDLRDCPHCGGWPTGKTYALMSLVFCQDCGAEVSAQSAEAARDKWNRRVP